MNNSLLILESNSTNGYSAQLAILNTSPSNLSNLNLSILKNAEWNPAPASAWVISRFSISQVQALTEDQISSLDSHQIAAFTPAQIKSFNSTQIAAISNHAGVQSQWGNGLSFYSGNLELTPTQISSLTNQQVSALTLDQISRLSSEQVAALTAGQIRP